MRISTTLKSKPLLVCRRRLFFFQKFINDVALGHCDELWGDFEFSGEIAQALEIVSVFLELKRIIVIDIDFLNGGRKFTKEQKTSLGKPLLLKGAHTLSEVSVF